MRKIKVYGHAHWSTEAYEDIVEIDDDEDPEEVAREMILERIEWYWKELDHA